MERPRFTIRDLFWCVTLIGVGLGCWPIAIYVTTGDYMFATLGKFLAVILTGAAFIGAGLFAPFRAKCLGAVVGFALGVLALFAMF